MFDGRLRTLAVVVVLVVGGACSDGDSDTGDRPASTTSVSAPRSTSTLAPGAPVTTATIAPPATSTTSTESTTGSSVVPGEVTVRGTVLTVFASARVLQIDPPVDGYSRVALTEETDYRAADGSAASLQDVNEGSTVEVTGEPGSPGTVIAGLVVIVG